MTQTLIVRNVRLIDEETGALQPVDVVVRGADIVAVGPNAASKYDDGRTLDGSDKLIVPGFINAHYHSHDVLAKGTIEEEVLEWWALLALPPSFPPRSDAEIRVRTLIGALECLRGGITTVQDMLTMTPFNPEQLQIAAAAYEEIGLRAVIGPQYADKAGISTRPYWEEKIPAEHHAKAKSFAEPNPDLDVLTYLEEHYFSKPKNDDGLISWVLAPTAPEACSDDMIRRTAELAEKYDLQVFTHIYESKSMALEARLHYKEYDGSLINWMKTLGLVGPRVNLAHSVWLLEHELDTLAETGTKVVFNLLSNLKLKSGVPPIKEVQDRGISYALGCDNPSCSDAQNMFQAMKLTATLNAISSPEPLSKQAEASLEAATLGGARSIARNDLGRIAAGFKADFSLIDLNDPAWLPLNNATRQLVYSEAGRGVDTVVVNGDVVIENGMSTKIDEAQLRAELTELMPTFLADLEAARDRVEHIRPYLVEAHREVWKQDVGAHRILGPDPSGE